MCGCKLQFFQRQPQSRPPPQPTSFCVASPLSSSSWTNVCLCDLTSLSWRVEVFMRCPGVLEVELVSNTMRTETQPVVRKMVSSDRAIRDGFEQAESRLREEINGEQKLMEKYRRRAMLNGSWASCLCPPVFKDSEYGWRETTTDLHQFISHVFPLAFRLPLSMKRHSRLARMLIWTLLNPPLCLTHLVLTQERQRVTSKSASGCVCVCVYVYLLTWRIVNWLQFSLSPQPFFHSLASKRLPEHEAVWQSNTAALVCHISLLWIQFQFLIRCYLSSICNITMSPITFQSLIPPVKPKPGETLSRTRGSKRDKTYVSVINFEFYKLKLIYFVLQSRSPELQTAFFLCFRDVFSVITLAARAVERSADCSSIALAQGGNIWRLWAEPTVM